MNWICGTMVLARWEIMLLVGISVFVGQVLMGFVLVLCKMAAEGDAALEEACMNGGWCPVCEQMEELKEEIK